MENRMPGKTLCFFEKITELEEIIKIVMDENIKLKKRIENLEDVTTDMMGRELKTSQPEQSTIITVCDDCPCNITCSKGPRCSLDYAMHDGENNDLGVGGGINKNWHEWSEECGIDSIVYCKDGNGIRFAPKRVMINK